MNRRGAYVVPVSGLNEGDHVFSFNLDKSFFSLFEFDEIDDGSLEATVIMERKSGLSVLSFSIKGMVKVKCDRCLEYFMASINIDETMFVRTGEISGEIEDNVIVLEESSREIEVGQYIFEFVVLGLPLQRIHPADKYGEPTCDRKMLAKLEAHLIKNQSNNKIIDPRWDVLKGIIEKGK